MLGIAIAQLIFQNSLAKYLEPFGLSADTVTEIRSSVLVLKTLADNIKDAAISAYVLVSLTRWIIGIDQRDESY